MPHDGVLILDKPAGVTSHDVVSAIRRILGTRKVGHLGTLDPAATGVLPVVVGKATRLARYLPASPKEYTGEIQLGWETTTDDDEGTPLGKQEVAVTRARVEEAMRSLTGRIRQTPPAYSAKKVDGVRAYKLAREGRPVGLRPVTVEIDRFEIVAFNPPRIAFRVVCSTGTYVRSLARDLGRILDTGGHLISLRRTRAGIFGIEGAVRPDQVSPADLIPPGRLLAGTRSMEVDDDGERLVRHGSRLPFPADASPLCIFNKKGELIAIARAENGWAHPEVVLI